MKNSDLFLIWTYINIIIKIILNYLKKNMNKIYKNDFPIFNNNNKLVYLDSTATSQKPKIVIEWIKDYLENSYSNIYRWLYSISERSEELYKKSKKKVLENIWANSIKEIIYTYNSTYALNLLASSLRISDKLKKWDKILLTITEHNANLIPWLILEEEIWIEIEYVNLDGDYNLDLEDFRKKYDKRVKIISFTHVSNVTGQIFDLEEIWKRKREDTIFIVDASQSIPHFKIDINKLNCDYLFFTWHKVFADTWIWILWWKEKLLKELKPSFSWWGAIWKVGDDGFSYAKIPEKFEPGTPNITWAVSLLKAFEYIENIWWYKVLEKYEYNLVEYFLEKIKKYRNIKLIWSKKNINRIWVFSIVINWIHSNDIADILAEKNIAVRSWKHCAHRFFWKLWLVHSFRVSLYIYNTKKDIDIFFDNLNLIIENY